MTVRWNFFDHSNDAFIEKLLRSKGEVSQFPGADNALDQEIRRILRNDRRRAALKPWVDLVRKLMSNLHVELSLIYRQVIKEYFYGLYRQPVAPVHGGSNPPSGAGAGTLGVALPPAGWANLQTVSAPPEEPEPIAHAGIRAGEIVAYRCWRLNETVFLSSMAIDYKWIPGKEAEGNVENGQGIHGFKSVLHMVDYGGWSPSEFKNIVTGTVYLWGDVIEHERGYRASHAAIASIDDSPYYDAEALRDLYGLIGRRKRWKYLEERGYGK